MLWAAPEAALQLEHTGVHPSDTLMSTHTLTSTANMNTNTHIFCLAYINSLSAHLAPMWLLVSLHICLPLRIAVCKENLFEQFRFNLTFAATIL